MPRSESVHENSMGRLACIAAVTLMPWAWSVLSAADGPTGGLFGDPTADLSAAPGVSAAPSAAPGTARQRPDRGHLDLEATWRAGDDGRGVLVGEARDVAKLARLDLVTRRER